MSVSNKLDSSNRLAFSLITDFFFLNKFIELAISLAKGLLFLYLCFIDLSLFFESLESFSFPSGSQKALFCGGTVQGYC